MKMKIDRKQVDKAIKEMELFPATKEVISAYENEVSKLDKKELELKGRLEALQCQLVSNLQEKELTDDVSLSFNLTVQSKKINEDADVINLMLEQLREKRLEVKLKYLPIFQDALKNDYNEVLKYNTNELVNDLRYAMLKAIADLSNEMAAQYEEVAPAVYSIFEDPTIMYQFPSLQYAFYKGKYVPHFENENPVVISKADVFSAVEAGIVSHPNPNGKDNE